MEGTSSAEDGETGPGKEEEDDEEEEEGGWGDDEF